MDKNRLENNPLQGLAQIIGTSTDQISKTEVLFRKICRTCLCGTTDNNLEENLPSATKADGTPVPFKVMLEDCTGFKIETDDKLPHHICNECLNAAQAAYTFRTHSQRVDKMLKNFIDQMHSRMENFSSPADNVIPATDVVMLIKSEKIDEPEKNMQTESYQAPFVENSGSASPGVLGHQGPLGFTTEVAPEEHQAEDSAAAIRQKLFKCELCPNEYRFRNGLHNHMMKVHPKKKTLNCQVCKKVFKSIQRLKSHHKKTCIPPSKKVVMSTDAVVQIVGDTSDMANLTLEITNFPCAMCGRKFEKEIDFNKHMLSHKERKCPHCNKFVSRTRDLESHIRAHTKQRPFVCPFCAKRLTTVVTLRSHIQRHSQREIYTCSICGKEYLFKASMEKHQKTHGEQKSSESNAVAGEEDASKECNEEVLSEEPDKTTETELPNDDRMDLSETVCKEELDIPNDFSFVQKEFPDNVFVVLPTRFSTPIKQEKSNDESAAYENANDALSEREPSEHEFAAHLDNQCPEDPTYLSAATYGRFKCAVPNCKMEFKHFRELVNHYSRQHIRGPSPFKCPICLKEYAVKLSVRNHLKTHLKCEYRCPYCPRSFLKMRNLTMHVRTHTGERPYQCTVCNKQFPVKSQLRRHQNGICRPDKLNRS